MHHKMKFLKDIVDHTPLPIAVFSGEQLTIELANPAMIRAWGKGDQIIGKNYLDVLPEVREEVFFEQALGVLRTGIPVHAKDKKTDLVVGGIRSTYYFNYSFIPLFDGEGAIYGVMNTGVDVTDLHMARQQVESAEERLRIAIESSGMGTYEIDLGTGEIKTSGHFNAICGIDGALSREQLVERLHPDDLPERERAHQAAQSTGNISYEARILNDDQSVRWTRINGRILKDEDGVPSTIIGIIQDISEQRTFEEELRRQVAESTSELRRSNDDLLHFAGIVSHDLREPVRKIKIFSTMLRDSEDSGLTERSSRFLEKIGQSSERMGSIIEGILAYSTLDKTLQPVEAIRLSEVIENIKTDLELVMKEKGAILVACELPEIEGAPILISQLFYNLLHNALKFSKAAEPPKIIMTSILLKQAGRDFVQVSIQDNGIGFESAYADKIFGTFERLHSKDAYEGNGLGLALCRKIAKRHQGAITASGQKGQGAVFTVTLPLSQGADTI